MVLFKVYGERNSGTNFLMEILRKNNFPVQNEMIAKNIVYYWKHGIPRKDLKEEDDLVVDIIIFRRLDSWLVSMFKNVYHLKKFKHFNRFLTMPQKISHEDLYDDKTGEHINIDDDGKTIFEIRYFKFKKIMEYREEMDNVILVSLEYLQNKESALKFLRELNDRFMDNKKETFISEIKYHTKNRKQLRKNLDYNINTDNYREIIDNNKNNEIENFINKLEYDIKSFEF